MAPTSPSSSEPTAHGAPHRVPRRRLLIGAAGVSVGALLLAACGSDADGAGDALDSVAPATEPTDDASDANTDTSTPADESESPGETDERAMTLPDDGAVLEIGFYGGFTPFEVGFQSPPSLLVTADGLVIRSAPVPAIFPGPLLPQHTVATLSAEGMELLVEVIDDAGLLADVEYESDPLIADAATTTVIVRTADDEYRHEAYALGFGGGLGDASDESPERQALANAVDELSAIEAIVGDELGPEELWEPDAYQLVARPVDSLSGYDVEPTVLPWPAATGVVLADTDECTEVDRATLGSILDDATQLTIFTESGVTYQVVARPAYPGRTC